MNYNTHPLHLTLRAPLKGQIIVLFYWMCNSIKCLVKNYLHMQICWFCELLLAGLEIWPFLTPTWSPRLPPKSSKIVICSRSVALSFLWANVQFLERYTYRNWQFLTPRVPQKGSKILICPKRVTVSYLSREIISLCSFWGLV